MKRLRPRRFASRPVPEGLESRDLLSTFTVSNLSASGAGSLRQAILDANAQTGPDTIDFTVAGTIRTSLPAITDTVSIDGTTAPGFAGTPVLTVNFRGAQGLRLQKGSEGSVVRGLSLVNAGSAGITLNAPYITIQGNFIGLLADGKTVAPNHGDGIRINASSHDDLIGNANPVASENFYDSSGLTVQPVLGWQGIRNGSSPGQYLITGTSGNGSGGSNGLLYVGPISGAGGTSYIGNFPHATSTSTYGPNLLPNGAIQLVGTYQNGDGMVHGFFYQGTTSTFSDPARWRTIDYPGANYTYIHSVMGDFAVGNAAGVSLPTPSSHAFLYSISQNQITGDIAYPGAITTSAYGIWWNGGTSYTITGGFSGPGDPAGGLAHGYLVNYDSSTGLLTGWTPYDYPAGRVGQTVITHFEGISSPDKGIYTLAATSLTPGDLKPFRASIATVFLNSDGSFGPTYWTDLNDPKYAGAITNNSVAGYAAVGIVGNDAGAFVPYQATVNIGFQLSNVISGNSGNGIGIYGSNANGIFMNNIGTDVTGTQARGNARHGIYITSGAAGDVVGGPATGGNDPTNNVFVRPPQGNLISANGGSGVYITGGAKGNYLSGNFIGTDASGNAPLGNHQDGVSIVNANGNQLIGCDFQEDPFVHYNVISGNRGNGLRITNSNNTTVHANFLGTGANNSTPVANGGDGLLVNGSSKNTQIGGVIPLGNVISGNAKNGLEIAGTASGTVSFNTFAGVVAFGGIAPNGRDGVLISSTGGNNLIRTCIVSANLGNGIELNGGATGVQITDTAVGTNTSIQTADPNQGDGILIAGHAHQNAIGGFQPSVEPHVTVSANRGNGIEIAGTANHNVVFDTYIGSDAMGRGPLPNGVDGVAIDRGTSATTLGGPGQFAIKVLDNTLTGISIVSSRDNVLLNSEIASNGAAGVAVSASAGTVIGTLQLGNTIHDNGEDGLTVSGNVSGTTVVNTTIRGNAGDGVDLSAARGLAVGGGTPAAGNPVLNNAGYGVYAAGNCKGTVIQRNPIRGNAKGDVNLTNSTGITYVP
jgi:hypothetical protein